MPAPKQNKNAAKGPEAMADFIHIRMTPTLKGACVRSAKRGGQKLSEWVTELLTKATKGKV